MAMVKKVYKLKELDCANCAMKMQDAVGKLEEVAFCEINFLMQRITLEFDEDNKDKTLKQVQKCIKKVERDCRMIVD